MALLRVLCALQEGTVGFAGQSLGSGDTALNSVLDVDFRVSHLIPLEDPASTSVTHLRHGQHMGERNPAPTGALSISVCDAKKAQEQGTCPLAWLPLQSAPLPGASFLTAPFLSGPS